MFSTDELNISHYYFDYSYCKTSTDCSGATNGKLFIYLLHEIFGTRQFLRMQPLFKWLKPKTSTGNLFICLNSWPRNIAGIMVMNESRGKRAHHYQILRIFKINASGRTLKQKQRTCSAFLYIYLVLHISSGARIYQQFSDITCHSPNA